VSIEGPEIGQTGMCELICTKAITGEKNKKRKGLTDLFFENLAILPHI
jgi:hypothetical protein